MDKSVLMPADNVYKINSFEDLLNMPCKGVFSLLMPSSYKLALMLLNQRAEMMKTQAERYPENTDFYVTEFANWLKEKYDNPDFIIFEQYYDKKLREFLLRTNELGEIIQKNEYILDDYSPKQRDYIIAYLKSGAIAKCIDGNSIKPIPSIKLLLNTNSLYKTFFFNTSKTTKHLPKLKIIRFIYAILTNKPNQLELIQDFFNKLFGEKALDLCLHYIAVQTYPEIKKSITKDIDVLVEDKNFVKIPIKVRDVKKGREIDLEQDAYAIITYYFQKARVFLSAENHISDVSASKAMQILSGYHNDNIRKKLGSLDFSNNQRVVVKEKLEEVIKLINKDLAKK